MQPDSEATLASDAEAPPLEPAKIDPETDAETMKPQNEEPPSDRETMPPKVAVSSAAPADAETIVSAPKEHAEQETISGEVAPSDANASDAATIMTGPGTAAPQRGGVPTEVISNFGSGGNIRITDTRVQVGIRKLGNFELLGELGHGGMGVVYKARQINPDRLVALKMILTGSYAAASFRRRFEIEAEAVGNLRQKNIVTLFESGEIDGNLYYTMPLIEGNTLSDSVENEKWLPRESAELMKKLAEAIAHAHQRGVLHRDLKPSNILLDKDREPFITDFGLAKITDENKASDMTMSGDVMGSPGYMAPEQAQGKTHEISMATDVYGLGVIMYQVITGHPPFQGETVAELLQHVIHTEPPRPKSALGRVDRDLSTICLRCMDKNPKRRYPTAAELAEDLDRWLKGEPIKARAAGLAERSWKWARRNPLMTAFIAMTVTLSTVAVVGIESQRRLYRDQLLQSKIQHAEGHEREGQLGKALARYADILRIVPNHKYARARVRELLRNHDFGPQTDAIDTGASVRFPPRHLAAAPSFRHLIVADENGIGRIVDTQTRAIKKIGLSKKVRNWNFSADGKWFFVGEEPAKGCVIWDAESGDRVLTIPTRSTSAPAIALTPDKSKAFTIDATDGPQVWDLKTLKARSLYPARVAIPGQIPAPIMSADGRRVLVFAPGRNPHVVIWDLAGGAIAFEHHFGVTRSVDMSRDGKLLAVGDSTRLEIWDIDRKDLLWSTEQQGAEHLVFSPDGRHVVAGLEELVTVRNVDTQKEILRIEHEAEVEHLRFDHEGRRLALGFADRSLRVWNVPCRRPETEWIVLPDTIKLVGFTEDSADVMAICQDGLVRRFAVDSQPRFELPGITRSVTFSSDSGQLLVSGGGPGCYGATLFDLESGDGLALLHHTAPTFAANFSPDENHVLLRATDFAASVWSRGTNGDWVGPRVVRTNTWMADARFSADGSFFLTASRRPSQGKPSVINLWKTPSRDDPAGLQRLGSPLFLDDRISQAAISPDGRWVAAGTAWRKITLWQVGSNEFFKQVILDTEGTESLSFSADGRYLACATGDAGYVLTVPELKPHGQPLRHAEKLRQVRFSPDGKLILTSSLDGLAQLWDLETMERYGAPVDQGKIFHVEFSPDGKLFATATFDGFVRVWDVHTRQPITAPKKVGQRAYRLAFSPDGKKFAATGGDGFVGVWSLSEADQGTAEELIQKAESTGRYRLLNGGRHLERVF